jgi:hypothetical protein
VSYLLALEALFGRFILWRKAVSGNVVLAVASTEVLVGARILLARPKANDVLALNGGTVRVGRCDSPSGESTSSSSTTESTSETTSVACSSDVAYGSDRIPVDPSVMDRDMRRHTESTARIALLTLSTTESTHGMLGSRAIGLNVAFTISSLTGIIDKDKEEKTYQRLHKHNTACHRKFGAEGSWCSHVLVLGSCSTTFPEPGTPRQDVRLFISWCNVRLCLGRIERTVSTPVG